MQYVSFGNALKLTGLTEHQLREWTTKRALVEPDRTPQGPGTRALFSWRSLLRLRVLAAMHQHFGIGLEESRRAMADFRAELERTQFVSLWDKMALLSEDRTISITARAPRQGTFLVLALNPHLEAIAEGFAELLPPHRQMHLFPALPASAR